MQSLIIATSVIRIARRQHATKLGLPHFLCAARPVDDAQQQPARVHPFGLFAEKTPENQLFYLYKIKHTEPTVDARMGIGLRASQQGEAGMLKNAVASPARISRGPEA
ncbi:MAG: hypothetical protein KG075_09130 [Alphaproteobacteria bacterium]|nr:hypothetical protein [Alphaproteobacteria bacterium]